MGKNQNGIDGNSITGQCFKKPGIIQTSILFSLTIVLFIFIGYRVQDREFYSGVLLTEFGLIMLPALLFLVVFRFDLKAVLRLNSTRPLNFLVTFAIMLFAIPLAGAFNLLNLLLVNSIFGKVIIQQAPIAQNGQELLINILVIAGSAGLCEEFLFRGVIQRGFERFGAVKAILLAAFLFSLTHMDFQKIFGTLLLGALIGFIVHRTNSLFCGMFAHFTNNALAVLISYAVTKLMSLFQGTGLITPEETDLNSMFSSFSTLTPQQLIAVIFIYGFIFLFVAAMFILLLYALIKMNPVRRDVRGDTTANEPSNVQPGSTQNGILKLPLNEMKGLIWLLPGILLIAGIYYFEVYRFTGAENGFIEAAKRVLGI